MTQDELDELMDSGVDTSQESQVDTDSSKQEEVADSDIIGGVASPPAMVEEHKVVNQLDSVTKDSELKANEVFDKLDEINEHLEKIDKDVEGSKDILQNNVDLFEKLCAKFPNVQNFNDALEDNKKLVELYDDIKEKSENSSDDIMNIMDIMQYQDIHRQKIERVINVMRALSKYMNSLFESNTDDTSRVSSAQHIEGDDASDVVDQDEIEALLASFSK